MNSPLLSAALLVFQMASVAAGSSLTAFGSVMCPDYADRLLQDAEYRRCVRQAKCQHLFGQSVWYTFGELELRPQHRGHPRSVFYPGIEKAFGSHRDKLVYQARQMERTFSLPLEFRKPTNGLRFTQTGLELIRNPVDLEKLFTSR